MPCDGGVSDVRQAELRQAGAGTLFGGFVEADDGEEAIEDQLPDLLAGDRCLEGAGDELSTGSSDGQVVARPVVAVVEERFLARRAS